MFYNLIFAIIIMLSILAISLGIFATFFNKKFSIGNSKMIDKVSNMTGSSIFKNMSEQMVAPYQMLTARVVGILFIIIGFASLTQCLTNPSFFYKYITFLINILSF